MHTERFNAMTDQLITYCDAKGVAYTSQQVSRFVTSYSSMAGHLGNEEIALSIFGALLNELEYVPFDPWAWLQLEFPFETLVALTKNRDHALAQFMNSADKLTDELLDIYNLRKNRFINPL